MVPSRSTSWLRPKLEEAVPTFKHQPYHGHLLLLLVTARWWEWRRLAARATGSNWVNSLVSGFLFPSHHLGRYTPAGIILRHPGLLRARLWNTSPKSRRKITCAASVVKEICIMRDESDPEPVFASDSVGLFDFRESKHKTKQTNVCLDPSFTRRANPGGVWSQEGLLHTFIQDVPHVQETHPDAAGKTKSQCQLSKHRLNHLRAFITPKFNCLLSIPPSDSIL